MAEMMILGMGRLLARLEGIKRSYPEAIKEALQESGNEVQDEATLVCPVDTGNLKASIRATDATTTEVRVGTDIEYAPYVEYGTAKAGAQPFMRPGLSKARPAIIRAFKKHFQKVSAKYSITGGLA